MTINVTTSSILPTRVNLGSGKDYRADYFNIDIDNSWSPDAVVDLASFDLDAGGVTVQTHRFGDVRLRPGTFETIIANDVLEHVPNLVRLMTNCLKLLKVGGVFEINVPYDLSYGAWQDPTHVRAFNERSWLYYTDWFWYLGWSDARFVVERMTFVPSSAAAPLASTVPMAELQRMPRMIDAMSVSLRKVELTAADRNVWENWRERKRLAQSRWSAPVPTPPAAPSAAAPASPVAAATPSPATPAQAEIIPQAFAGGWAAHRDRHCLWVVTPEGYKHHQTFDEFALGLSEAFAELGGSCPIVRDPLLFNGRIPIVLGTHLLRHASSVTIPADSILVNFEQVVTGGGWINEGYLSLLRRFPVLDYSIRNRKALIEQGITNAGLLGIGYSPGLARIPNAPEKDIDVLFYGSLNPRRKSILEALRDRGLKTVHLFGAYGAERDAVIARAKLVLNLHFYESAIFEVVRVSYLLANGVCVVSEGEKGDPDIAPFEGGLVVCGYEEIVDSCTALIADDASRIALGVRGRDIMMARRQSDLLKAVFGD
ncbi:methyltransferase domain-containing protein [Rhodomicrobium lacus]|uniref:methyltransferase domain-containing protein n=1 Tax=Rhodomicrobium lacus TaxID=2498452 RepID=UPI0026E47EC8|nr:class I SAM-dependent methyltransferase [Rhodomicrobium lacus]WKW51369.1 class I SAM-dependent methyltransferase [Rhodomicrobium lacus]